MKPEILKSVLSRFVLILLFLPLACNTVDESSQSNQSISDDTTYRDLYSDTWVASDALGRTMPSYEEVGPVKNDKRRVTGMFYITWHTQDKHKEGEVYNADVSKILQADPAARLDANHELWYTNSYHWGEPEMGYFLSQDEYVIRKDMSMLTDAGVDVLVMDVTNAVRYWDEWDVTFSVMQKMKEEGNQVPKFCFWAFNGPVITVVQDLYEKIYKEEKDGYRELYKCARTMNFIHAIWSGNLRGIPTMIFGYRRHALELFLVQYGKENHEFKEYTVDIGTGPSNVTVVNGDEYDMILSSSRHIGEATVYYVYD